ncbi:hypothetical protein KC960_03890 [Candidatus Saccharibacteria bacterium]|nr:hypothetical protein [Candidatus Saccharibacteria bacterium]
MRRCPKADGAEFDDYTVDIAERHINKNGQSVANYLCNICGKCAEVPIEILDDPDMKQNLYPVLANQGLCDAAQYVAPFNEGIPRVTTKHQA